MVHEAVAQRYASALFQLGVAEGHPRTLLDELTSVESTLEDHPALARALQAPNVPDTVKKTICKQLFSARQPQIINLLYLLVDKRREAYVGEIARQYRKLLEDRAGVSEAEVETAVPLPEPAQKRFALTLGERQGREVKITWKVNPDLVGGYILRQGDHLTDCSFRAQFVTLQRRLEG